MKPSRPTQRAPASPAPVRRALLPAVFAGCFGGFLGLTLLKFGNPPIMEKWVTAPADIFEFLLGQPWPIAWSYTLLVLLGAMGVMLFRREPQAVLPPAVLLALPAAWLGWQLLAAAWSAHPALAWPTFRHFVAALGCFYLGLLVLPVAQRQGRMGWFWAGLLPCLALVLASGWDQHFGGLERSRQHFFLYVYPTLKEMPPEEFLKKLNSTRIFATLFYPNTLAGALLLLTPPLLVVVWTYSRERFTKAARMFLVGSGAVAAVGCLFWSGSKGGCLLALLQALGALFLLSWPRKLKWIAAGAALAIGLSGFAWKYSAFFAKGATSVVARFDYWRAATDTALAHPVLGTGPGTFAPAYEKVKRPESEMSRLVHNDYLEQASDSGFPGLLLYLGFVFLCLARAGRNAFRSAEPVPMAVAFGLVGWFLQGFFEFGLYIPALAWTAFALLGWLVSHAPAPKKPDPVA